MCLKDAVFGIGRSKEYLDRQLPGLMGTALCHTGYGVYLSAGFLAMSYGHPAGIQYIAWNQLGMLGLSGIRFSRLYLGVMPSMVLLFGLRHPASHALSSSIIFSLDFVRLQRT